jgi:hypothetical protein
MGYTMRTDSAAGIATAAATISQLLNCGFCYVTSEGGKLMALLSNQRSMLVLRPDTVDTQVTIPQTFGYLFCMHWYLHQKRVDMMSSVLPPP